MAKHLRARCRCCDPDEEISADIELVGKELHTQCPRCRRVYIRRADGTYFWQIDPLVVLMDVREAGG